MNKIKRQLFSMEAILDSRIVNEQVYYLVKWAGYPIAQSTWEKSEKVMVEKDLLTEYQMNVQMLGKTFYFDPLDQAPQIEEFVDVPKEKSELATFNTKLFEFQRKMDVLRDEIRSILQTQQLILKLLKYSPITQIEYDMPRLPISQEQLQSKKSEGVIKQQSHQQTNPDAGSFENGDIVEKIGRAVQIQNTQNKMYYILWNKRQNGVFPKNTWVGSQQLLENDPIKLCQYLWTKLPTQ